MSNINYFLSLFLRRLPAFLIVAASVATVSIIVAFTLPPAYESKMVLIVEAPQIPDSLAATTVRLPASQRLQLIEQRLMTRANLLDIATRLNVLEGQSEMTPDGVVQAMRARTSINTSGGRGSADIMTVSFEAPTARMAAVVLNEYLSQIQEDDTSFRRGRAGQTLDFFEQEVSRLGTELEIRAARIVEFKNANAGALPDDLAFRQQQLAERRLRLEELEREIFALNNQKQQLVTLFENTGRVATAPEAQLSPAEQRLKAAQDELDNALLIYSDANPRVRILRARVEQLREAALNEQGVANDENTSEETGEEESPENSALNFQLAGIDTRIASLERQSEGLEKTVTDLQRSVDETPNNSVVLEELQREYDNIVNQYNPAVERLALADTGERIEILSRGERLSVIEQPTVPSRPTKPNRMMIAGGGTAFGILLGLGLVALIVLLNSAPRRPEDLINKLDIWPIATIPYVRTRRELIVQRGLKLFLILIILVGVPAMVWAVHTYYQPLDLIADRLMNKLGVRW